MPKKDEFEERERNRREVLSMSPTTAADFFMMTAVAEDFVDLERVGDKLSRNSALYYSRDGGRVLARISERKVEIQELVFQEQLKIITLSTSMVEVETHLSHALAKFDGMAMSKRRCQEIRQAAFQRQLELLDETR
jgi:hypothetical protein